jgi:hypothetical protein
MFGIVIVERLVYFGEEISYFTLFLRAFFSNGNLSVV